MNGSSLFHIKIFRYEEKQVFATLGISKLLFFPTPFNLRKKVLFVSRIATLSNQLWGRKKSCVGTLENDISSILTLSLMDKEGSQ